MGQVTEQAAAGSEEMASSSEELGAQAQSLGELVERFKIDTSSTGDSRTLHDASAPLAAENVVVGVQLRLPAVASVQFASSTSEQSLEGRV